MPQRLANVELTQSFNAWRVRTNDTVDFINQLANTTGVAQVTSANATFTNIITLSGNSTFSGNVVTFAASVVNTNILSSNVKISGNLTMTSTGAVKVPSGTTAQRAAHNSVGHFRYNTSTSTFEGYTANGWIQFQSIGSAVSNSTFQSALANTNAYIATKVNTTTFNSALANTNSYIATTAATERSSLANTNSYIAAVLANTNAYIANALSGSAVGNIDMDGYELVVDTVTFNQTGAALALSAGSITTDRSYDHTTPRDIAITLAGNFNIDLETPPTGTTYGLVFYLTQDGSGGRVPTFRDGSNSSATWIGDETLFSAQDPSELTIVSAWYSPAGVLYVSEVLQ